MHRRFALVIGLVVAVAACGGDGATPTTNAPVTTASGNTLETLPPPITTTTPPITTTTTDPIAAEYGSPIVQGDPLPEVGQTPDPAVGMAAPVAVGAGFDGTEARIGGTGSVQAVLFAAHWCSHCQNELPEIATWLNETGGVDGVDFVLVNVAVDPNRGNFPPSEWIEREGWPKPVLLDDVDNSVFRAFGGSSIPYWVFIAADGTIAARVSGETGSQEVESILVDMAIAP